MRINTSSSAQTKKIGKYLGEQIVKSAIDTPIVIALAGDLGTGKTTFVKGLAQGLGIKVNVVSPTFILIGAYKGPRYTLYHIDPYRLEKPETLKDDLKEVLRQRYSVIAIEWAPKLKRLLPKTTIWVECRHKEKTEREIFITFPS